MKTFRFFPVSVLLLVLYVLGSQTVFGSSITGTVYDNRRNPLPDVDVELLDDLSRFRGRVATDGNGRYEFSGLGDGRFTVRVLPFRYDLASQEQSVEIVNISAVPGQTTTVIEIKDFYLTPRKGSIAEVEASVIFVQEIPKDAQKIYEKAIDALSKKRSEEGVKGLKQAIEIFPNYFLALQRLGKEYFLKGNFAEAAPLLIRAADVNNKSPLSFYTLGYCLLKLGYNKAAIVSLKQASFLSPASASVLFSLGTAERLAGQFTDAEVYFIQAKKLSHTAFPDLHWQLAMLYGENLKRYSEAADELEEFLKARPDAVDAEKIRKIIKSFRDKAKAQG